MGDEEARECTTTGCCINKCKNATFSSDVVYFPFPVEARRKSLWMKLLKEQMALSNAKGEPRICSDHFRSSDIVRTASQPELSTEALPHVQSSDKTDELEGDEEEAPEKAPRVKVEALDCLRPQGDLQSLETAQSVDHISVLPVKMELHNEEREENIDVTNSSEAKASQNSSKETEKEINNPRKVKITISPDKIDKFIKERKLQKLPSGAYRVMEDVLKEIESCSSERREEVAESSLKSGGGDAPVSPVAFKRKRGRPRKGTFVPRTVQGKQASSTNGTQIEVTAAGKRILSISTNNEEPVCDSTEAGEVETDSENKPKRRRRSKVLDDYVADFNTSDEEEGVFNNRLAKFSGRGRGRGRGRKSTSSEVDLRDRDFFSSYIGVFSKKFSLQEDFAEDDMLDVQSESEEDLDSSESPSAVRLLNILEEGSGPGSGTEMTLGPEGKTKVQIVNTGETSMVNGKENLIYHVITTTGSTSTVTPLTIPKEVSSELNEGGGEVTEQAGGDAAVQGENPKRAATSRTQRMQNKRMVRTYNQKLTALRQQYSRAVQELRKRRLYTLADLVCGASRFLTEEQLVFFTLQLKSGCHNMQGVRYSVREKILALAFYLQSPALYKWLRAIFHLPTKLILERWLEGIAKSDPDTAKRLMYHVYTRYIFKQ
ncbi:uncharacterized protein LOC122251224 isoform X2 [Penaeus japonicus]|uniref:uncharacterized protein LOC122251224 isoform X2 n=1 Tax=Penaeus japonicus TaxID=27405 RepID=UPI001C70E405|nr:uncharacterized protein LOC122251224 isoform X2 [Penaeus japonicus]